MKCPYCGTVIRPDEKICSGCGYKNPDYNPNAYKEPKKEEVKPQYVPPVTNTQQTNETKSTSFNNTTTTTQKGPNVVALILLILFCWPIGLIYLLTSVSKK